MGQENFFDYWQFLQNMYTEEIQMLKAITLNLIKYCGLTLELERN